MSGLKIYVDSLKMQEQIIFNEQISPEFLGISENELKIEAPVQFSGQAYLSDDFLILHFAVSTYFQMPCKICNENVTLPLVDKNYNNTISLAEIKHGIYDFSEDLRQALLLKLPDFVECNNGSCPKRKNIEKQLKKPSTKLDDTYLPFETIL
jgi:hypothetical protein